jgi:putative colanic acid biosynthesis UDP-glucose lipid carrier transferase
VSLNVQEEYTFPRLFLLYFYSLLFLLTFLIRITYYLIIRGYYKYEVNGKNTKKVVILGTGGRASALYKGFLDTIAKGSSFRVLGFFEDKNNGSIPKNLIMGKYEDIKLFCLREKVNEIYYTESLLDVDRIKDLTKFADENFIYLRFVPDFSGLQKSKVDIFFLDSVPIIEYTQAPLGGFLNQRIKRIFDIVFSLGVIIFVYPFVFPIVALIIKLESNGPVLFKQDRPGKGNELFKCYKFRTMRQNDNTERQAVKDDPRITGFGKFLRKTSLDEFPQFFNVLQGKMSVVGPRPNLITQLEFYSKEIEKYRFRHFITPGITGWAQVNGYRGETKEINLMKNRVELDAWYIENWSLSLDIKIIFLTVFKLVVGDKRAY